MEIAEMKSVAGRFHKELIQEHRLEVADEIVAPDAIIVTPFRPADNPRRGPEGAKEMSDIDYESYPDGLIFDQGEHTMIAEGDCVCVRWDAHGFNQGPFGPCPPSYKEIRFNGVDIYRFNEKGQIAQAWICYDALNIYEQFGAEVKLPG